MSTDNDFYIPPPLPADELPRLKELHSLEILETEKEQRFDHYTALAADMFNLPVAIITLLDKDYQWFKSCFGASLDGTPRDIAFCSHTLLEKDLMVIPDMLEDKRFISHPLVKGAPYVRFYAGVLLKGPNNHAVGTLCLIGFTPHDFSQQDQKRLIHIGKMVEHELHYRHHLNQLKKQVENTIFYDTFTDLPTTRLFQERLAAAIQDQEEADTTLIVLCLGVLHFDKIKMMAGQKAVNLLLKEIHWRLKHVVEMPHFIAKGSDNFFLIFGRISSSSLEENIKNLTTALLSIFQEAFKINDQTYEILSGKIGMALYGSDEIDGNELINKAVVAMNMVLHTAESTQLYSLCPIVQVNELFYLENKLVKAIKNNELYLTYQPIIDVQSEFICGAEVLCRWTDAELGPISPTDFIPLAEQSGLIILLGEWVLKEVVQHLKRWQEKTAIPFPVSVNLSGNQLLKKNFFETLIKIFKDADVSPSLINLEVTEASLIYDLEQAIENIQKANQVGLHFSLDDFGTGFSSLKYLQRLPIKYLKIDKSFMDHVTINAYDGALVQGIIALARSLGLGVVAEGIETQDQFLFLKKYHCQKAQGFLFSKPLLIDDFINAVEQQKKRINSTQLFSLTS